LHVETPEGSQQNVLFDGLKTDTVTNSEAQFDDHPSTATGASVAGAAVGDPGDVESRLMASGFTDILASARDNGTDSFWKRGGSCVDGRSVFNRYTSFTSTNPAN